MDTQSLENLHLTDFWTGLLCFSISLYKLLLQCLKLLNTGKEYQSLREAIYFRPHYINFKVEDVQVICQKWVRVFHQGFQTPRNRWKHEAASRVLLLFRGVWNPWWNTKHEFLTWLLKLVWEFSGIISKE